MSPEQQTVILRGKNARHYWSGEQPLSIKMFARGRALYAIDGAYFAVDEQTYFIVNERQHYTIEVDAPQAVESFCIFFAPALVADVWNASQQGVVNMLDVPPASTSVNFYERTHLHDQLVTPRLKCIRDERDPDPFWLDEQLHDLLHALFARHQVVCEEVSALDAAKPATREEIYRRAYRAREYAAAFAHSTVTLHDMAQVACLSPNHLLRAFRQVFHQSPHQFLTAWRLQHARNLLRATNESVTDICLMTGFTSLGSFSTLFRRHVGISPEAYRRALRNG